MIGMILPGTMKYCPYIQYYIKAFKSNNIPFEIISWDKLNLNEPVDHAFKYKTSDGAMVKKTIGYIKFRSWLIRICEKKKYDKLIVFTIAPAVLLENYLKKEYSGRYYLDIRDDTILRKYIPKRVKAVINGACGIISSSKEFDAWIERDTSLCHNVDVDYVQKALFDEDDQFKPLPVNNAPNRIMFAGAFYEWKINFEMIQKLKNNPDFSFIYHTPDSDVKKKIMEYCTNENVQNVSFYGAYNKEELCGMYREQSDWVNIIRCESVVNRNALPNKFYDAAVAGLPVIVLKHNKAIYDYVVKYNLGLAFDNLEDLYDNFIKMSKVFDYEKYYIGRKNFLTDVMHECYDFSDIIVKWANE